MVYCRLVVAPRLRARLCPARRKRPLDRAFGGRPVRCGRRPLNNQRMGRRGGHSTGFYFIEGIIAPAQDAIRVAAGTDGINRQRKRELQQVRVSVTHLVIVQKGKPS
jgi:hypothetical protein